MVYSHIFFTFLYFTSHSYTSCTAPNSLTDVRNDSDCFGLSLSRYSDVSVYSINAIRFTITFLFISPYLSSFISVISHFRYISYALSPFGSLICALIRPLHRSSSVGHRYKSLCTVVTNTDTFSTTKATFSLSLVSTLSTPISL